MTRWLLPAGLVMAAFAIFLATRGDDVRAAGPCGTTHDAVDAEEQQFLGLLQSWRAGFSNEPVETSGALNMAAAWFAEWQVTNSALGGHIDSLGRSQAQRAIDCGYTIKTSYNVYWASVAGEGVKSSASTPLTAQSALAGMVSQQGSQSGIHMTGTANFPAKCYGVGVYRSGQKVSWVVVIAQQQFNLPCPGGSGGGTPPTVTNTPTATPTKTPTATPTPPTFRSWFSQLSRD